MILAENRERQHPNVLNPTDLSIVLPALIIKPFVSMFHSKWKNLVVKSPSFARKLKVKNRLLIFTVTQKFEAKSFFSLSRQDKFILQPIYCF